MLAKLPPISDDMPKAVREAAARLNEGREAASNAAAALQSHEALREKTEQLDRDVARDAVDARKPMPDPEHLPAWQHESDRLTRAHEAYDDAVQLRQQRLQEAIEEARPAWTKTAQKHTAGCLADARAKVAALAESVDTLTAARTTEAWLAAGGEAVWRPERAMPRTTLVTRGGDHVPIGNVLEALQGVLDRAEAAPPPPPIAPVTEEQMRGGAGLGLSLRAVS